MAAKATSQLAQDLNATRGLLVRYNASPSREATLRVIETLYYRLLST
jgi:hypothetical protein